MDKALFLQIDGQRQGPYETVAVETMVRDGMSRTTLCWREGMSNWRPLAEVLPGGGPHAVLPIRLEVASVFDRCIAMALDGFILIAPCAVAAVMSAGTGAALLVCVYMIGTMRAASLQGTFGMKVMKLKVVDEQGQRISFWASAGRFMLSLVSGVFFGIGYLFALFSSKKQTFHDLVAGTYVVKR